MSEEADEPFVPQPYFDVSTHVRDELRRAWLRVEYQIRLGWTKTPQGGEQEQISPDEMGGLFAGARGEATAEPPDNGANAVLEQWLDAHRKTEARIRATIEAQIESPLVDLIHTFGLSARQWSALMFALLPEVDPNLVQAYRYLAHDPGCRGLEGRLLAQLVYDTPQSRALMARDLSPSSALVRMRLLEVISMGGPNESLMFRRIRAAPRLVYVLDGGHLDLDPELAELAELPPGPAVGLFPDALLDQATAALRSGEVIVAVQGQRGLGKKLFIRMAAERLGLQVVVVDSKRLSQNHPSVQPGIVRSIIRELMMLRSVPLFADVDGAVVTDEDKDQMPAFFDMFLDEWDGPVAISINRERMPRITQRPIVHMSLETPSTDTRAQLWTHVVPVLTPEDAESLATRYAIPGGVIVAAAHAANAGLMPDSPPLTATDLDRAVAQQLHQRISRLGKKLPTPAGLDDLVCEEDVRSALKEICAAARDRRRIREQFKLRGAQGLSVLFSGHPGVGKTMSGTVLAKMLGLDIYEIDLSQVVSKWLGETEKNLGDVFDAAEPGHVVLLFNEADSLFGKRTSEVKSSNDRYANLETNYLLQRLERFHGLAILTTNLSGAIDQAFKRRFSYDVYYSFPTPELRCELWKRTLPQRQRAAKIDFEGLAEKYELTGGFIKVACERASYVAGSTGGELNDELLCDTVERMYRERGKLATAGPLE